jgi:hypothetical protein
MTTRAANIAYQVSRSEIHGNGVFARRKIRAGALIDEYEGERISADEAALRAEQLGGPLNHTFFFSLSNGSVIDGGMLGNDARYINHACTPNCEAREVDDRVFVYALRDIARGEELNYNYALEYEERHTPAVKRAFVCHCGTPDCTGSMLAPKKRKRAVAKA